MKAVTHLEKVIAGETSAVTHLEKVIARETTSVAYTEKVIAGEVPPITHLQKVIAGVAKPVTHQEYVWAGGSPPSVQEYTGAVPVTFIADGTPLLDLLISGNEEHNGTPTPDNPIMPEGCGERAENLFDYNAYFNSVFTRYNEFFNFSSIQLLPNTTYTFSTNFIEGMAGSIKETPFIVTDSATPPQTIVGGLGNKTTRTLTTDSSGVVRVYKRIASNSGVEMPTLQDFQNGKWVMLNTGSTALPYEPYGYKLTISSANTTTPVYLGEVETTRRVKKYECTGDESWSVTSGQGKTRAVANFTTSIGTLPLSKVVSTHYIGVEGGAAYPDINTISINNNGTMIIGITSEFTDSNAFKSYLAAQYAAGTPVTVWYVLANEETAVVNEPLMKIGDYADSISGITIPTVSGSNTLDVGTTLQPSEVTVNYKG